MPINIEKELPGIKKNISLKEYTTFRIGGPAKYFFEAKNKKDIIKAILVAKKMRLPFFILGSGSNILAADDGFDGVVIKIKNEKLKIKNYNEKFKIICDAGAPLTKLVSESLRVGAAGFEWAIGIPGTVGGAVYGNAGAFNSSMADVVKSVEVLEIKNQKCASSAHSPRRREFKIMQNKDCQFSYRESVFKKKKKLVILSAELQLKRGNKKEIENKMREYLNYRKTTQPLNYPSSGSAFKNPSSFSAGELIEKCGLKGKRIGNAKISEKHANFVINLGGAKAADVKKLINLAKNKVKNKFKIKLKEEVQYLRCNFRKSKS